MVIAVLTTLPSPSSSTSPSARWSWAAPIGWVVAKRVEMTQMPELVAAMHSLVGMAAVLIAARRREQPDGVRPAAIPMPAGNRVELFIGTFVGAITFSGSIIAFGKLAGLGKNFRLFSSAPVVFPGPALGQPAAVPRDGRLRPGVLRARRPGRTGRRSW